MLSNGTTSRLLALLGLTLAVQLLPQRAAEAEGRSRDAVAMTPHFVFFSDFDTNLNDALIAAGKARTKGEPELFQSGNDVRCFTELAPSARAGWNLAVDYYAEIVSPAGWSGRPQILLRNELAALEEQDDPRVQRFISISRAFMTAAAPAYRNCQWDAQDKENRAEIALIVARLETYETAIAARLETLYATPWHGLPIKVDLVATGGRTGASTRVLEPGGHTLMSSSFEPGDVLEIVFHEASHTLCAPWIPDPLPKALQDAARALNVSPPGDLWHVVLFYTTGETVRRAVEEAGEPAYTPIIDRLWTGPWARFRNPVKATWPAYLNGGRTLSGAATDLLEAIDRQKEPGR